MNLNELTINIKHWSVIRGLNEADPSKQMIKLIEEVGELAQGLSKDNKGQIKDSIGDIYVVLTILAQQLNLDVGNCIYEAYNEIKDRKGKMVNGVFVKESDLKEV